jgi:hypothetical protein
LALALRFVTSPSRTALAKPNPARGRGLLIVGRMARAPMSGATLF